MDLDHQVQVHTHVSVLSVSGFSTYPLLETPTGYIVISQATFVNSPTLKVNSKYHWYLIRWHCSDNGAVVDSVVALDGYIRNIEYNELLYIGNCLQKKTFTNFTDFGMIMNVFLLLFFYLLISYID